MCARDTRSIYSTPYMCLTLKTKKERKPSVSIKVNATQRLGRTIQGVRTCPSEDDGLRPGIEIGLAPL